MHVTHNLHICFTLIAVRTRATLDESETTPPGTAVADAAETDRAGEVGKLSWKPRDKM